MQIHNLIQGTPEWLEHRATHFNASDAPAMMGCSPYKTRTQLLQELHTGVAPDVDAATQRLFDDGHRFEALARPLAEEIIGEDIYPVVGSEGKLSASFDGLTMDYKAGFEHKTLNQQLSDVLHADCKGFELPLHYRVQMEQQCLVSGAKRILFMATKWEGEPGSETLVEQKSCWYYPDEKLRAEIVAGWAQLEKDLQAYAPAAADVKPEGRAPEALPALLVEISGQVTNTNLPAFKEQALALFSKINRDLKTDEDFANAEQTVKWCSEAEARLAAAKQHALAQTANIDELFRTIDDISAEARRVRLDLDKLVKARKDAIRGEIKQRGVAALAEHISSLNTQLGKAYMTVVPADFESAMKGKKTVASLNDAVDTVLAKAKIEANAIAGNIQINLNYLREHAAEFKALFPDTGTIVLKAHDDLVALVKARIAEHKEAEAQRQAKAAEQQQTPAEPQAAPPQPAAAKAPTATSKGTAKRPTDDEIIDALAMHFRVHESKVIEWLLEVDLKAASERMAAEFPI